MVISSPCLTDIKNWLVQSKRLLVAEEYFPDCFRKEMYIQAYSQYLTPVNVMSFWPECGESSIILPAKPKTIPDRPSKKRIRARHETVGKRGQISRSRTCFERLGAWFGLNHGDTNTSDENQNLDPVHELETQQSQAATSSRVERDEQTTNDSAPIQATPTDHPRPTRRGASTTPVRPREKSQRILQKKLSKINSGAGSSSLMFTMWTKNF
ncbi:hypothetical protein Tco_1386017 [Tanacetum coccineum]